MNIVEDELSFWENYVEKRYDTEGVMCYHADNKTDNSCNIIDFLQELL